jgi:hypothetical protein
MQISSALCDIHQSLLLLHNTKATIIFRDGRAEQQEDAFACQDPDCSRYYSPWRGYFFAKVGEYPDFGVPSKKPQCRHESETMYMFLTWKDGMLLWACPVKGCGKAEPFKPPADVM